MALKEHSTIKIMRSDPVYRPSEQPTIAHDWYRETLNTAARPGTMVDFTSLNEGHFTSPKAQFPNAVNAIGMAEKA